MSASPLVNGQFGRFRKGSSSFGDNKEFSDVTLAYEDGQVVEAHNVILAGLSPKTSNPILMFELNGSCSDVQKTKTKTAIRSPFWLPKIGT